MNEIEIGACYIYSGCYAPRQGQSVRVLGLGRPNTIQPDEGFKATPTPGSYYCEFEDGKGWNIHPSKLGVQVEPPAPPILFDLKEALNA